MINRGTLAAIAGLALMATPAAADGPNSWTGFYIGAHGGYAWADWGVDLSHTTGALIYNDPFPANATSLGSSEGAFGGLQVGGNYQYGSVVLGIEADVSWGDLDADGQFDTVKQGPFCLAGCTRWNIDTSLETLGTVRGRLGFTNGPLLVYGTAGLAWGLTETKQVTHHNGPDYATPGAVVSGDSNHVGYAVGAGGEYRLSPNWSLKLEYLYIDLGEANYHLTGTTTPTSTTPWAESFKQEIELHTVRLGVNYKFGN